MKKLVFALVLFMSAFFAQAQVSISLNIGTPPSWGPEGNDNSRYYYLPDIDTYYDVTKSQYIYDNNGRWIRESSLPARYRQYDLYKGYKVVLNDYRGDAPYAYHKKHRENYPKGYHGKPQKKTEAINRRKTDQIINRETKVRKTIRGILIMIRNIPMMIIIN